MKKVYSFRKNSNPYFPILAVIDTNFDVRNEEVPSDVDNIDNSLINEIKRIDGVYLLDCKRYVIDFRIGNLFDRDDVLTSVEKVFDKIGATKINNND